MFVTDAEKEDIEERIAEAIEPFPKHPKYLQKSMWMDPDSLLSFSPTAQCTLTDNPLPRHPLIEFQNSEAIMTINQNPHLFQIVTPIKVDRFEKLLETHPNRPFASAKRVLGGSVGPSYVQYSRQGSIQYLWGELYNIW
jgi:hypothetical protein